MSKKKRVKKAKGSKTIFIVGIYDNLEFGGDVTCYESKEALNEAFDNEEFDVDCQILEVSAKRKFRADRKLDMVKK